MTHLINNMIILCLLFITVSFKGNQNGTINYNTPDYLWRISLSNGLYVKYNFIGDVGLIKDRGIYEMSDSTITIIRTKSFARLNDYPVRYTITIPNKDTITVDGLTYYKAGGAIKPPKVKKKKKHKQK